MVVNQANMAQLFRGYSALFNKGFNAPVDPQDTETLRLEDFAMTVPSTSGSSDHTWIGQILAFRKWIGSRTVNQLDLGKITVAKQELACLAVPADKRLGLRSADGRPNPDYCAQCLLAVEILQFAVYGHSCRLDKLAHLKSRRTPAGTMIRLIA